jgi:hypothetical protein
MARLSYAQRQRLPKSSFAVPEKDGYPIDTVARGRNALARVSQFGSPEEQSRVRGAVRRRYPGIKQGK